MDWKKELFNKKGKKPDYRVALVFGAIMVIAGITSGDYIISILGVVSIISGISNKNKAMQKGGTQTSKMAEYFKGRNTGKYREVAEQVGVAQEEKREKKIRDNRTVLLIGGIVLWAVAFGLYILLK